MITRAMSNPNTGRRTTLASQLGLRQDLTLEDKILCGHWDNAISTSTAMANLKKEIVAVIHYDII